MRLWHVDMIPVLPRQQLLGQHREVAALRGNGWGQNHAIVKYVYDHPFEYLVAYHQQVIKEMKSRGYKPNPVWEDPRYRGQNHEPFPSWVPMIEMDGLRYPEHDINYLWNCIENLRTKIQAAPAGKYDEAESYRFLAWAEVEPPF